MAHLCRAPELGVGDVLLVLRLALIEDRPRRERDQNRADDEGREDEDVLGPDRHGKTHEPVPVHDSHGH